MCLCKKKKKRLYTFFLKIDVKYKHKYGHIHCMYILIIFIFLIFRTAFKNKQCVDHMKFQIVWNKTYLGTCKNRENIQTLRCLCRNNWTHDFKKSRIFPARSKHMFAHSFNLFFQQNKTKTITSWCKKKGLRIASIQFF